MTLDHAALAKRYEEYKIQGYTVFEQVYDRASMDAFIAKYLELQESTKLGESVNTWFSSTTELAPRLMLPVVANPLILDFAELVMGPFVQLDNLTLAGFPTVDKAAAINRVSGWHRDRWANMPFTEQYASPLSINAISYLQDLTDEYGPLRVIPGSHRRPLSMEKEQTGVPHPDEVVLHVKAGDVVLTHNGLVHSGTPNTSGKTRYFLSVYYSRTWLKYTDNHSGPNVQQIIQGARKRNDHRLLRLFGVDDQLERRVNSGFLTSDEVRWAEWIAADKAAIIHD